MNDLRGIGKPCIYRIRNKVNNKCYIGSAAGHLQRRRQHYHLLRSNKHFNSHLQSAWNRYKEENFIYEVLQFVSDKQSLIKRERWWISRHSSANPLFGYNITENPQVGNLGMKMSKEAKDKMSKSKKGKKHKREHCAARGLSCRVPIIQYTKSGDFVRVWSGAVEAGEALNIDKGSITKCCVNYKGYHKTAGGFIWKYKRLVEETLLEQQGELLEKLN